MVIDFERILSTLPVPRTRQPREIATQETLQVFALQMARSGYRHSAESLDALADWINGYGILLAGDVGTGKTFFFKVLPSSVPILSMRECYLWPYARLDGWLSQNDDSDILVDDLGAEVAANNFGSKFNAINPILERRLASSYRTHFTTNYTSAELLAKYDDTSIVDRIFELARPHRLPPGESRRVATATAANVRRMQEIIFSAR